MTKPIKLHLPVAVLLLLVPCCAGPAPTAHEGSKRIRVIDPSFAGPPGIAPGVTQGVKLSGLTVCGGGGEGLYSRTFEVSSIRDGWVKLVEWREPSNAAESEGNQAELWLRFERVTSYVVTPPSDQFAVPFYRQLQVLKATCAQQGSR